MVLSKSKMNINHLEKLECAKPAYLLLPNGYLLLPLVTLPCLSLHFLTFLYLSLPFLSLTDRYLAFLGLILHLCN